MNITKTAKRLKGKFVIVSFMDHWSSRIERLSDLSEMVATHRASLPKSYTCGLLYDQTPKFIYIVNSRFEDSSRISGHEEENEAFVDFWAVLKSAVTHIEELKPVSGALKI